jgi:hypothetical protein
MKKNSSVFTVNIILVFFTLLISCSKGGSTPTPTPAPPAEETLKVSTNTSSLNITPGADFDFTLSVDSKMPTDGVKIEYTLKGEIDNQDYAQGPAIETKTKSTDIRLRGMPRQKFCVCNITVTSKTKPSNTATTSFRVVYK